MNISAHITHTLRFKRRPFIPQGCDQQGRLEPTIQPQAAECCTELGAESEHRAALTNSERVCLVAIWFASAGLMGSLLWHVGSVIWERFQ